LQSIWQPVANSLHRLSTAEPRYVVAALVLYIASLFIVGARWRGFVRALGGNVSVPRATLATLGGIAAGNLTPGRVGGEACRIGLVRLSVCHVAAGDGLLCGIGFQRCRRCSC
jgi:uncharacterized protein (TIRG00374 family)